MFSSPGPNNPIVGVPTAAAMCIGPASFDTNAEQSETRAARDRRERCSTTRTRGSGVSADGADRVRIPRTRSEQHLHTVTLRQKVRQRGKPLRQPVLRRPACAGVDAHKRPGGIDDRIAMPEQQPHGLALGLRGKELRGPGADRDARGRQGLVMELDRTLRASVIAVP